MFSTGMTSEVVLDRQVGVGDRLGLDALRRVDDEQRAFAGAQAARHLVVEVDVPGRVDQLQLVFVAVLGAILQPHGLRLDRDPALALELELVQELVDLLAHR